MAWTSGHFAAGMICGGAIAAGVCALRRRGWRYVPVAMTAGGMWAMMPDLPRLFREDFPSLPFAATLGTRALEKWLHGIGDVFFFHNRLDAQPHQHALAGLFVIILLYNAGLWTRRRRRLTLPRLNNHTAAERPYHLPDPTDEHPPANPAIPHPTRKSA